MAGGRIKLFEADIDVDGIIKKSGELKQAINDAKDAMVLAKFQTGETSKEYIKAEANVKKLSSEYRINQQQIINLTSAGGNLLTVEQKLTASLDKEVRSIENAVDNNEELRKIRNSVNAETEAGQKAIADINKKIDENTAFIKENTDSYSKQKMEIGDYKTAIKDAYNELNIFNGGIMGFIQRAQAAGGVMPLMKKGLTGITQGIMGATKASLAFIATPLGAIIAAIGITLGIFINYLKSTQAGIDAVTSVTRPLSIVFQSLIGILQEVGKYLFDAFSNPKKTLMELSDFVKNNIINRFKAFAVVLEGIINLDFKKISNGVLQATTGVEDVIGKVQNAAQKTGEFFSEAVKRGQEIDKLQKQLSKGEAEFITLQSQLKQELKEQNLIAEDRTKTLAEREAAAKRTIDISREINGQQTQRLKLERQILELKSKSNDTSDADLVELAELNKAIAESKAQQLEMETTQNNKLNGIRKQVAARAKEEAQKVFDESIKRQQLELQMYLEGQGIKKRTMAEELKLAEETSAKLIDIERQKLKNKKITEEEFKLFVLQNEMDLARQRVDIASENLDIELEAFKKAHEDKLATGAFFSAEAYKQEQERLALLLAQEQAYWDEKLSIGAINQTEYNAAINALNEENRLALEDARIQRDEAEKEKQIIDLENKRAAQIENLEYDLEFQLAELEAKRQLEVEAAEKSGADLNLINEKYAKLRVELEEKVQDNKMELSATSAGNFATILGKETALGKAAAIMQATIQTYQAAISAYSAMSAIPVVGPALGAVAAGAAVAMGLANVKKIASAKAPKAERGAVFNIEGKRHRDGGTTFYDGQGNPQFEAEKDEKMFILNRRASAALGPLLSGINQKYGGISLSQSSSYLARGGQVYRNPSTSQQPQFDFDLMAEVVGEGVRQGSREGSMEGSSRGTYSGIVDKETNEIIASGANF